MDAKHIHSFEDYLEKIVMVEEEKGNVRSIDIANKCGFTRASISIAIKKMEAEGLLTFDKNTHLISLSPKGRALGEKTYEKHKTIKAFFLKIGVSEESADHDACLIEHDISDETFEKFKEFLNH